MTTKPDAAHVVPAPTKGNWDVVSPWPLNYCTVVRENGQVVYPFATFDLAQFVADEANAGRDRA